jgi:hypothetical protein
MGFSFQSLSRTANLADPFGRPLRDSNGEDIKRRTSSSKENDFWRMASFKIAGKRSIRTLMTTTCFQRSNCLFFHTLPHTGNTPSKRPKMDKFKRVLCKADEVSKPLLCCSSVRCLRWSPTKFDLRRRRDQML